MSIRMGSPRVGMPTASGFGLNRGIVPPCGTTMRAVRIGIRDQNKIARVGDGFEIRLKTADVMTAPDDYRDKRMFGETFAGFGDGATHEPWAGQIRKSTIALANGARSRGVRLEIKLPSTTTGFVHPDAAGVFQIVLDAERAGDAFAFENFGGDGNPAAVTDERDEFALLKKFARERKHLRVTAQFVRHETAGNEQPAKILAVRVLQQQRRTRRDSRACRRRF